MLTVRIEQPHDVAAIRRVHAAAFPSEAEARLVDSLRAGGRLVVSCVALNDGDIVGHLAFSPVEIDCGSQSTAGLGLAPIAVLPACQRKGIGSRLIAEGLAVCAQRKCGFVVVLGEPAYYRRFGFVRARDRGLDNEYGVEEEFMVLELQPRAIPAAGGLVRYAPEFAVFIPPTAAKEKP
jgi:putative acetyltransferase